jgi:hypothetical protein
MDANDVAVVAIGILLATLYLVAMVYAFHRFL